MITCYFNYLNIYRFFFLISGKIWRKLKKFLEQIELIRLSLQRGLYKINQKNQKQMKRKRLISKFRSDCQSLPFI